MVNVMFFQIASTECIYIVHVQGDDQKYFLTWN